MPSEIGGFLKAYGIYIAIGVGLALIVLALRVQSVWCKDFWLLF